MNNLIVGYGEIGQAVGKIVGEHEMVDLEPMASIFSSIDVMHICFPYSDNFVTEVKRYIEQYSPSHVIIYSTVPVGTTYDISPMAVHSPVEGVHPYLEDSIRLMERWLGCEDKVEGRFFVDFFEKLGLKTRLVGDSDHTEALKLLSTTEYGVNLVFADYKAYVAEKIGMDFELTKEWNRAYNRLYKDLGMEKWFQKFVLDPPEGKIGGHCVIQNAILLQRQFPDDLVKRVRDTE